MEPTINDNPRERFTELKAGGLLPSPKGVALAIMNLISQPTTNAQDIARLVQADPAMAGRILRYANAAHGMVRHIVSLGQAIVFLGLFRVRQIVLGFSLIDHYRAGACTTFDYAGYWQSSLAAGIAAQKLAHRAQLPPDESFSCGLLAGIGRLGLATAFPARYASILANQRGEGDLAQSERAQFGIDHAALSAEMLDSWGFPPIFSQAVRNHEMPASECSTPGTRAHALCVALNLATRIGRLLHLEEPQRRTQVAALLDTAAALGMVEEEVVQLISEVVDDWKTWARDLKLPARFDHDIRALLSLQPKDMAGDIEQRQGTVLDVVLAIEDDERRQQLAGMLAAMKLHARCWQETDSGEELLFETGRTVMLLDAGNERPPAGQQLQHLRRLAGEGVYVIVLIPDARESDAMRLLDEGVADYLPYSFTAAALAVRLATARRLLALQDEIRTDRALMTRSSDEWARANRRLLHEALTDPLTQLPNRRYGLDRLNQEWEIASSNQLPIACLMLDIDHFKRVNDQHGHDIGDAVLRQMATVVERCCRRTDFVFRYGGEEFCVICPQTAQAEATLLGERIAAAIREQEFVLPNDVLHATLSVGVGVRAPAMNEAGQMLASADQALYAAKQAGRNRVVTAGDHLPARDRTEARMAG